MGFRTRTTLAVASLLLVASCGGGVPSSSPSTSGPSSPTVSLPLQETGLAVGGDVQSQATDVLRRGITEEQAKQIAEACAGAAEIANASQDCALAIIEAIKRSGLCGRLGFCLEVFDVSSLAGLRYDGYVEIVEDRPEKSLCGTGPRSLCLRVATSAVVDRVAASSLPSTTSEATTSTSTETTTPTSGSDTSSSTSAPTSPPTASS